MRNPSKESRNEGVKLSNPGKESRNEGIKLRNPGKESRNEGIKLRNPVKSHAIRWKLRNPSVKLCTEPRASRDQYFYS